MAAATEREKAEKKRLQAFLGEILRVGAIKASDQTLFLIAGYARYNCPYVWIRSHHHRLVNLTHASSADKDNPLKLNATNNWGREEIHLWDILAELVHLCTVPAPRNPFAVDLVYFQQLPLADQVTSTGAMVWLLQQILKHSGNKEYTGKVFEDLHDVTKLHFQSLQQWAREKMPQQQQQQQRAPGAGYRPGVQRGPTAVYGY
uniref:DUF7886 domain-containing protein n=1 Tax=Branchiostoma floridae TaxID=7739 RepID=C3YJK5_BRAFL|eukprot:XP_002603301.1 hypothetical protein BRAFLDRAFT_71404 [Branchiostoma floridae]